ncbi:unnamed protein product [Chondrus crispus]|uniref:Uncharacterized protein n=1 Tax=Chondrus crispus TaxID=2769 RepID=R7QDA2_CHOCR|nr:unnamed protein product [Chondrus crispus]CDF35763.1 unnamed protein product [Chondrus crispus]|eukprot:XP_005715582.1 unnamed protein product [Chondrus crispus]
MVTCSYFVMQPLCVFERRQGEGGSTTLRPLRGSFWLQPFILRDD